MGKTMPGIPIFACSLLLALFSLSIAPLKGMPLQGLVGNPLTNPLQLVFEECLRRPDTFTIIHEETAMIGFNHATLLFLSLLALASPPSFSATIEVPKDYPSIQQAIDAAAAGDVVLVSPGTYPENLDFKGKAITVKSDQGAELTVIDGQGIDAVVTIENGEGPDSLLEGFTVTNGLGGLFIDNSSSPTIRNNIITANITFRGAGLRISSLCKPLIENNLITNNHASDEGGGFFIGSYSKPVILGNTISENTATNMGGGIMCAHNSYFEIEGNSITKNVSQFGGGICMEFDARGGSVKNNLITYNRGDLEGGGIDSWSSFYHEGLILSGNRIAFNTSFHGGGAYLNNPRNSVISGNIIHGNLAFTDGGGIILTSPTNTSFIDNHIFDNGAFMNGGGIRITTPQAVTFLNNTISRNSANLGGGLYSLVSHTVDLQLGNTILYDNLAPVGPEIYIENQPYPGTGWFRIGYSDVRGGKLQVHVGKNVNFEWGPGMISEEPRFLDPGRGDFHLAYDSPCRDAGSSAYPDLPDLDFEGDPRTAYGLTDMGADEFHPRLYMMGQSVPNGYAEIKLIGVPGSSPVFLWVGSGLLPAGVPTAYGDWQSRVAPALRGGARVHRLRFRGGGDSLYLSDRSARGRDAASGPGGGPAHQSAGPEDPRLISSLRGRRA